ncbi:MAG: DUF4139 domain-containing protein, partial [Deltaproteobacteria bacterium]|nr:DUF4139 domain-containing protein [Deltaproteobacteria bacterium]
EHARLQRRAAEARAERGIDEQRFCKRIVARLRGGGAPFPVRLVSEYRVPGATWRPTYVFRVARDGKSASIAVRALVAQQSGEPWTGVQLTLSTADLQRRIELPVLQSQRIGRRQFEQPPRAWREPPTGAESLFESLDSAVAAHREGFVPQPPLPPPPPPAPMALPPQVESVMEPPSEMYEAEMAAAPCAAPAQEEAAAPRGGAEMSKKRDLSSRLARSFPPPGSVASPAPKPRGAAFGGAPPPAPRRAAVAKSMMAKPAPASVGARPQETSKELLECDEEGAVNAFDQPAPAKAQGVQVVALEYHLLRLVAWSGPAPERGTLKPLTRRDLLCGLSDNQYYRAEHLAREAEASARRIATFPVTTTAVEDSAGSFDYSFKATGSLDVPNDGKLHNVPLFSREAPVELTLIAVPRESDQAVRVATLKNPLGAPILAGPADIYLENEFLVASRLTTQPAGATLDIGLGVEPALKVARNTHYKESSEGLLNGALALRHEVEIEIASRLPAPVQVEVRERVPLYRGQDKEVAVEVGEVQPAWEPFIQSPPHILQGGKRWRLVLPPGQTRKLSCVYTVRIDAKNELVGGNRRD